jgi:hypothetical protein
MSDEQQRQHERLHQVEEVAEILHTPDDGMALVAKSLWK